MDHPSQSLAGAAACPDEAFLCAEQVALAMNFSAVLKTAVDLDLFEIIAKAKGSTISAFEIVDQLSASNKEEAADGVDRILRLLASFSLLTCSADSVGWRVYGLSAAGKYFVRDEDGASLAPLLSLAHDKVTLDTWSKLKDSVLNGELAFNLAYGMNAYEYPDSDQRYNNVYSLAMFNYSTLIMKKVLQHYKGFENLKQLVDVGGGLGHTLKLIVSKYPSIKGINFDMPHVIKHAPSIPGVEHVGGDLFKSLPSPAEAIMMKWLITVWSDEVCVEVLKNCYSALPSKGKVILVESLVGEEAESTSAAAKVVHMKDMVMLSRHRGGRERTRKEYSELANAAGFDAVGFEPCACNYWVIEFFKGID